MPVSTTRRVERNRSIDSRPARSAVALEKGSEFRERSLEPGLLPGGVEFALQPGDFGEPVVDLWWGEIEARVLPHQEAVVTVAGSILAQPHPVRRSCAVWPFDEGSEPLERRRDVIRNRRVDLGCERGPEIRGN